MNNTKQYSLIPIEDGYVMVDKERTAKKGEYSLSVTGKPLEVDDKVVLWQEGCYPIIAHTGVASLKDSRLPLMESIEQEIRNTLYNRIPGIGKGDGVEQAFFGDGWINGYEQCLKDLKKHPVAVVVEMVNGDKFSSFEEAKAFKPYPKVINGFVQIKEILYER